MPRPRTNPQFNLDTIMGTLLQSGIDYHHIADLGGLRGPALPGASPNTLRENKSFRNYADYATTSPFHHGLTQLRSLGHTKTTAVMCAEAVWWCCHRRIIADYLLTNGELVFHILSSSATQLAILTKGVQRDDGVLYYPERTS